MSNHHHLCLNFGRTGDMQCNLLLLLDAKTTITVPESPNTKELSIKKCNNFRQSPLMAG